MMEHPQIKHSLLKFNMSHLITPITLADNNAYCCSGDNITDRLLNHEFVGGVAVEDAALTWTLYNQGATAEPDCSGDWLQGSVEFGVCCKRRIKFAVTGNVERFNAGYDVLIIYVNGIEVKRWQSTVDTATESCTFDSIDDTYTHTFDETPCGNIVTITGDTGDDLHNNSVYWTVVVTFPTFP